MSDRPGQPGRAGDDDPRLSKGDDPRLPPSQAEIAARDLQHDATDPGRRDQPGGDSPAESLKRVRPVAPATIDEAREALATAEDKQAMAYRDLRVKREALDEDESTIIEDLTAQIRACYAEADADYFSAVIAEMDGEIEESLGHYTSEKHCEMQGMEIRLGIGDPQFRDITFVWLTVLDELVEFGYVDAILSDIKDYYTVSLEFYDAFVRESNYKLEQHGSSYSRVELTDVEEGKWNCMLDRAKTVLGGVKVEQREVTIALDRTPVASEERVALEARAEELASQAARCEEDLLGCRAVYQQVCVDGWTARANAFATRAQGVTDAEVLAGDFWGCRDICLARAAVMRDLDPNALAEQHAQERRFIVNQSSGILSEIREHNKLDEERLNNDPASEAVQEAEDLLEAGFERSGIEPSPMLWGPRSPVNGEITAVGGPDFLWW